MLDEKFLTGLLVGENATDEEKKAAGEKIARILSEQAADVRGLTQKRDELLAAEKTLKERIKTLEADKAQFDAKTAELEESLKKAGDTSGEIEKRWQVKLDAARKESEDAMKKVSEERDYFKKSHLERLRGDAVAEGTKDLKFLDGLRDGFVNTVLMQHHFEPKDIEGKTMFLDENSKTIQEVMKEFALGGGKAYIANPSSGGGGSPKSATDTGGGKSVSREQFDAMSKEAQNKFVMDGGSIT